MKDLSRLSIIQMAILNTQKMQDRSLFSALEKAIEGSQIIKDRSLFSALEKAVEGAQIIKNRSLFSAFEKAIEGSQIIKDRSMFSAFEKAIEGSQIIKDRSMFSAFEKAIEGSQIIKDRSMFSAFEKALEGSQIIKDHSMSSVLQKALEGYQNLNYEHMLSSLNRVIKIGEDLTKVNFLINPDGTISGTDVTFNISDVENSIESCLSTARSTEPLSLEVTLDNIITNIAKQHPIITKILIYYIFPFMINILAALYIAEYHQIDQTNLIRQIKKEFHTFVVNDDFSNEYRFVSTEALNVRSEHSIKSQCVGRLHFGQLIHIVQKKKNWTLIEYHGKDDESMIKGWVFTRYIKRFD